MKYWNQMLDKYGFGDGSEVPADAWERRDLYIHVVNRLAQYFGGSGFKAVPYDRPGFHNPCMILLQESDSNHEWGTDLGYQTDDIMEQAIEQASELDLDQFIKVKITVKWKQFDKLFHEAFPFRLENPSCIKTQSTPRGEE